MSLDEGDGNFRINPVIKIMSRISSVVFTTLPSRCFGARTFLTNKSTAVVSSPKQSNRVDSSQHSAFVIFVLSFKSFELFVKLSENSFVGNCNILDS